MVEIVAKTKSLIDDLAISATECGVFPAMNNLGVPRVAGGGVTAGGVPMFGALHALTPRQRWQSAAFSARFIKVAFGEL